MEMPLRKNKSGQALLLIIVVMFIVFFLVVAASQGVTLDTQQTAQTQDSQQAYDAATTGLSAAKSAIIKAVQNNSQPCPLVNGNISPCSASCSYGTGGIYGCSYVIQPLSNINTTISSGQSLQANVSGSTSTTITYTGGNGYLLLNLITGSTPPTNTMCIFYPQGIANPPAGIANPGSCGSPVITAAPQNGVYSVTVNTSSYKFIRVQVLNSNVSSTSTVTITEYPTSNAVEGYNIIATGFENQSRRVLTTFVDLTGSPPSIFDNVLYNGTGTITF